MAKFSFLRSWLPRGLRRSPKRRVPLTRTLRVESLESRTLLDASGPLRELALPEGPAAPPPEPAQQFVNRLYYDLLHRSPAAEEVDAWSGALKRGVSREQMVGAFVTSAEYRGNLIRAQYRTMLGREPDAGGFAAWMGTLQNGLHEENIRAAFLGSPEYYQRHGNNPRNWITSLYGGVLGRAPDRGGLDAWVQAVQAGANRAALAYSFASSQEARAGLVTELYTALLYRTPDAVGRAVYVGALNQGGRPFQIAAALASSAEYYASAQRAGLVEPQPLQVFTVGATNARAQAAVTVDQPRPSLSGVGYPGTPLLVYINEVAATRTQVNPEGTWTVILARDLPAGLQQIQIRPVDGSAVGAAVAVTPVRRVVPAPQVTLTAPEFTRQAAPPVTVSVAGLYDPDAAGARAFIDVDLNRNGSFADPAEAGRATATVFAGANTVNLTNLPKGTLNLRARVIDQAGNEAISAVVTMAVDPDAGRIGSSWLQKLTEDYQQFVTNGPAAAPFYRNRAQFFSLDAQGRVLVNVRATVPQHLAAFRADLERLGMQVIWVEQAQNLVVGYLPIERIAQLPDVAHFTSATPVLPPARRVGVAANQGDPVMKTDQFRANLNVNGAGVKVGVISDSANLFRGGVADSVRTGDLPTDVEILRDGQFGDSDEGRAMMEIIQDVAPGAKLSFHTSGAGSAQFFAGGIRALADAGSRVIVDDIALFVAPFFNDGVVNRAVDEVVGRGVAYVSAAGNDGDVGYLANWRGIDARVGGVGGTYQDVGGNRDVLQNFSIGPGEAYTIIMGWDAAWLEGGSPDPAFQVPNRVHAVITNGAGLGPAQGTLLLNNTIVNNELITLGGVDDNPNTGQAQQIVRIVNQSATVRYPLAMSFHSVFGPDPTQIRWVVIGTDRADFEYAGGPTLFGHPSARGAIAVGAVPWWRPALPGDPGTRTALGGNLPYHFAQDGSRLPTPELRYKPEVSAPDGVSTSFFGSPPPRPDDFDPTNLLRFFGTSAAAPQVAALIALLRQQNPAVSVAQIMSHLKQTALDVGAPGLDPYTGFGLVQAVPVTGGSGGTGTVQTPPLPGDRFELNDTSDVATNLGALARGQTVFDGLTIGRKASGLPDYDWFQTTINSSSRLQARIDYNSPEGGDLHVRIFTRTATGSLRELTSSRNIGTNNQVTVVDVTAGQQILVWVYGFNNVQGNYRLTFDLT